MAPFLNLWNSNVFGTGLSKLIKISIHNEQLDLSLALTVV